MGKRKGKSKKPDKHSWAEAAKLCRLDAAHVEMAKKLGFGPDALICAIPSRRQHWKLPVKEWVDELYYKRFGHLLGGPPPAPLPEPAEVEDDREAMRLFEEQMYWEDYAERNDDVPF